jgi:hypothetical protein
VLGKPGCCGQQALDIIGAGAGENGHPPLARGG